MTVSVLQGNNANIDAAVLGASMTPADASSLTLTIRDASNNVVVGPISVGSLQHLGTGSYRYVWAVSALQAVGLYRATWSNIVVNGNAISDKAEDIAVFAAGAVVVGGSGLAPSGPYLTPGAFSAQYLGNDTSALSPLQINSVLQRASTVVDGYCSVPLLPQRHDFRGGVITGERHSWRLPDGGPGSGDTGMRRTYPYHWPIKAVQGFRIAVSNTAVALDIQTSEIVIQNSERYLEVVTLLGSTFGLFNAITMPNVFLATPTVNLDYTYGHEFRQQGEVIYNSDGATKKVFRAQNQWWLVDASNPAVVYVDGIAQGAGYVIDPAEGTVTFASAQTGVVSVDYTYRLPIEIRDATALIARFELSQSKLTAKGLMGLESVKMAELEITQRREPRAALVSANNLDRLVPEAADLLSGMKFYRMAA